MKCVYIQPDTEVVRLNTTDDLLLEMDPTESTDIMLGNQGEFDEEEDDFDDFSDEF
jgi:hypothetical protein